MLPFLVESLAADACDIFVLFVDLCDSTAYKQQCLSSGQPDVHWIVRQLIFLERAAKTAREYGGTVIKTIGDEILVSFEATIDPEKVLKCAIEIIQGFENLKAFTGPSKIDVKAAIDFGLAYNGAIEDTIPFDPIGLPVDRCARLNKLAKRGEIVFSKDFLGLLEKKFAKNISKDRYGYVANKEKVKGIGSLIYYKISASLMEP